MPPLCELGGLLCVPCVEKFEERFHAEVAEIFAEVREKILSLH